LGDGREVSLWPPLPHLWLPLLEREWKERERERERKRDRDREREIKKERERASERARERARDKEESEKKISRACMSVGGAATFRGQAGLAKNDIKHGSRAHQCKHGIVLLHSHAGRRDGFAHSSSVAVGLRSRPLKHTVALSYPYLSLFVF